MLRGRPCGEQATPLLPALSMRAAFCRSLAKSSDAASESELRLRLVCVRLMMRLQMSSARREASSSLKSLTRPFDRPFTQERESVI